MSQGVCEHLPMFQVGHTYAAHSACNYDAIYTITILSRSPKMVTYHHDGRTRRSRIHIDAHGEFTIPDHYSMAPVFRADREAGR